MVRFPPRFDNRSGLARRIVALAMLLPCVAAAQAQTGEASRIVSSYGLRSVDGASALDVELTRLDGAPQRLSSFEGRWLVATFFATWCGPCRSEMPSLEQLHRLWAPRGVTVIGVSIDDRIEIVKPFVDDLGITFPTLWDAGGEAARTYRADSIPLTYLIDPRGRIVGVARGARDWMQLQPMFEQLTALGDSAPLAEAQPASPSPGWPTGERVELPHTFEPPTAEVRLATEAVRAGEPFTLEIDLLWAGELRDYLPHPPWLALPDGVEQRAVSAATSSRDGANRVRYTIELAATRAGSFALDPIELRYTPLAESEPMSARVAGPTVAVTEPPSMQRRAGWAAATAALVAALAALAWRWSRRRGRQAAIDEAEAITSRRRRAVLDGAKRKRLEGRGREAFVALSELEAEMTGAPMSPEAEALRYAPNEPARLDLERLEKRIERLFADESNRPRERERAQLQLREEVR